MAKLVKEKRKFNYLVLVLVVLLQVICIVHIIQIRALIDEKESILRELRSKN